MHRIFERPEPVPSTPELFVNEEIRRQAEIHNEFLHELGRVAAIGNNWPYAVHVLPLGDGEIVARTKEVVAGSAGRALQITYNRFIREGFECYARISDFLIPMSVGTVGVKQSSARLDTAENRWKMNPGSGPLLLRRGSQLKEYPVAYELPRLTPIFLARGQTAMMVAVTTARNKQRLTRELALLTESTYEPEISRSIR